MRTLVIGFGNPSRRDDGVGLAAVNALRRRQGRLPLDEGGDGFDELTSAGAGPAAVLDTLFLQQLAPELAETLARYERVCFVDAHLGGVPELVRRAEVSGSNASAIVSHHLKPAALLALTAQLFGRAPSAELVSIRGHDFDFGEQLSPPTAAGVTQAVDALWAEYGPGAAAPR
jgi:hydrogenase maturation protease